MGQQILIVEDEVDIRDSLCEFLELDGFSPVTAVNGLEALKQLRDGLRPTLILLDLTMPIMNGWQFLEERNQDAMLRAIPVVVLTAGTQQAQSLGAQAFIRKPFRLQVLRDTVHKICGGGAITAPSNTL